MDKKKMNVVEIHSSFCIGGAENMVYELTKSFDADKVNAKIITLHSRLGTSLEDKVDDAGLNVEYVGCEGRVTPGKLLKVYRLIKDCQPDVIHAHMSGVIYGLPWLLTHKTKMFVTAHTTPDRAFNHRTAQLIKHFAKKHQIILVAVSQENQKLMQQAYQLDDDCIKCVNNGVDLSRYVHKEHREIVFINVGRHDKNKNQELMVRLFHAIHQRNADTKLILCGDGPEHERLVALAQDLGISSSVEFTGNVGNVQDYLARADIYLSASHREGLPLSTVEAMASSLPVISTDVGGMKNIVMDNGILVADGDEVAFYQAMEKLVNDESLRKAMGRRSREIADAFSSEKMAERYTALFNDVLLRGTDS